MMNVTILCVGKLKEKFLVDGCKEYQKRLQAFCKLDIIELNEYKLPDSPSESEIAKCLQKEGELILGKLPKESFPVAFCIEGELFSSEKLSAYLAGLPMKGYSHVTLIIGGSYGLSDAVKAKAKLKLSMSPMTFPHQLARLMALEQVYRAFMIQSGGKYHK